MLKSEVAIQAADSFRALSKPFLDHVAGCDINTANARAAQDFGGMIASATSLALAVELYLRPCGFASAWRLRKRTICSNF
jgi:hypothetical protein